MKKLVIFMLFFMFSLTSCSSKEDPNSISILVAAENKDLIFLLDEFAEKNNISIYPDIKETREILDALDEEYVYENTVWLSNSMWFSTLQKPSNIKNSKSLFIDPVVFGIKKSRAEQLGFINKDKILTKDILEKIKSGELKFVMPSVTQTNSGASAYLGFLSTLLNNPEVITLEDLEKPTLKEDLKTLFKGVERSSGSAEFSAQLISSGEYESMVNYESAIINLNKQLIAEGKEPLYIIYPYDGVSLSDSPLASISNSVSPVNEKIFNDLQAYMLSPEVQKILTEHGRRAGYGGLVPYADNETFNPDWGIDVNKYISPIKYPTTEVINKALDIYQESLRKPTATVFALDYSGSMYGEGKEQLVEAMRTIFDKELSSQLRIQFTESDKVFVIPFDSQPRDYFSSENFSYEEMLAEIEYAEPEGSTNIFDTLSVGLGILEGIDSQIYNKSIVVMSDGKSNRGSESDFISTYESIGEGIPIYSIMFGESDEYELSQISEFTSGLLFDGKSDLKNAFRTVRGYN